jgi:D-alanyl-D-alanine carboxypeptidase
MPICLIILSYLSCAIGLTPRYSAIVIEANSGQVLEQEGADQICHPASLTKMMTLYIIFEALKAKKIRMDTQVPVSLHAARQIPSKLGLRPGEYVSIETIIKALVTKSANDASAAVAEYLGGSESNFAVMMTRKAKSLNMHHTIFKNASGVPNSQQITTARDMATLSRCLYLHFPKDCHHFRLQAFHHRGHVHRNHNHLLGKALGSDASIKVEGIKTGFVNASGFNLAASAVRVGRDHKPMRLIAVVLGGPNRHWRDRRVAELLETNFEKVGLGGSSATEINDDEAEVKAFLKENLAKEPIKILPKPIPVSWSSSCTKPKPQKVSEADGWGVQLGTYKSLEEAKLKAKKTLTFLKSGEVSTPKVSKGKKYLYGARLVGLTKTEAETACKKFSKGKECRILASH